MSRDALVKVLRHITRRSHIIRNDTEPKSEGKLSPQKAPHNTFPYGFPLPDDGGGAGPIYEGQKYASETDEEENIPETYMDDTFISCDRLEEILDNALLDARKSEKAKLEVLRKEVNKKIEDILAGKLEDPAKLPSIWDR